MDELLSTFNGLYAKTMTSLAVCLVFVMTVGIVGNFVVVFVLYYKKNQTIANYFMMCLAAVDFFSCLVLHPYAIFKMVYQYDQHVVTCKIFEFLVQCSSVIQFWILLTVAVDRTLALYKPVKFVDSLRRAVKLVIVSVLAGVLLCVPTLIFYGNKEVTVENDLGNVTTHICFYRDDLSDDKKVLIYNCFVTVCIVSLVTTIFGLYMKLGWELHKRERDVAPTDRSALSQPTSQREEAKSRSQYQEAISSCGPPASAHARICNGHAGEIDKQSILLLKGHGRSVSLSVIKGTSTVSCIEPLMDTYPQWDNVSPAKLTASVSNDCRRQGQRNATMKRSASATLSGITTLERGSHSYSSSGKPTRPNSDAPDEQYIATSLTPQRIHSAPSLLINDHPSQNIDLGRLSGDRTSESAKPSGNAGDAFSSRSPRKSNAKHQARCVTFNEDVQIRPALGNDQAQHQRKQHSFVNPSLGTIRLWSLVTLVLVFVWTPSWVLTINKTLDPDLWIDNLSKNLLVQYLDHLFYVNNAINPLLYLIFSEGFRRDCRTIGKKLKCYVWWISRRQSR